MTSTNSHTATASDGTSAEPAIEDGRDSSEEACPADNAPIAPRRATAIERTAVALLTLLVASQLSLRSLLANTTPTGGDVGAHVWFPAFLRDHLLPGLNGWSDDWFAGFPAGLFYFPLPALLTVIADVLLPYGIAMKITIVVGALTLPAAVWRFCRTANLGPFPAVMASAAATVFLFDQFHQIYGGNIASAFAGMFSYSLGVSLSFFALAELNLWLSGASNRGRLIAFAAMAALAHLLTAVLFAAMAVLVVVFAGRGVVARVRRAALPLALAAGLTGAWSIPMLVNIGLTTDMGYERVTDWQKWLLPFSSDGFPADQTWHMWAFVVLLPAALVGAVFASPRLLRPLLAGVVLFALLYRFLPGTTVWNARWLPPMYLCAYIAAGITFGTIANTALVAVTRNRTPSERSLLHNVSLIGLVAVVTLPVTAATGLAPFQLPYVPDAPNSSAAAWSRWNFEGYERKALWPEYSAVMETARTLGEDNGCGRAMWDYDESQGQYGTPMAMMLLPYWTDGCIDSLEGLYFESSLTTPYHFMTQVGVSQRGSQAVRNVPYPGFDLQWGVRAMRQLGVRYYMAFSPESVDAARAHEELTEVAASGPWVFFEIDDHALVVAAQRAPVVLDGDDIELPLASWNAFRADPESLIATSGPDDWARASNIQDAVAASWEQRPTDLVEVSNVVTSADKISFTVDRPGEPVLVRSSYFPSWNVEGADGPWPAGPNMMLVVPTSTEVTMSAGSAPGTTAGWLLTAASLAAAIGLFIRDRRRRHSATTGAESEDGSEKGSDEKGAAGEDIDVDASVSSPGDRTATIPDEPGKAEDGLQQ